MELNEKQINALFERGNNFIRMGNFVAAVKDYDQVITSNPAFAPAYFNRGIARHHGQVDLSGAIEDYTTAIQLKPQFPEAYANRAIAYKQQDDLTAALNDLNEAIRLNTSHSAYYNRGEIYFLRGDYLAALADFQHAESLRPGYRYAIAGQAVANQALGEMETARQLWQ